MKKETLPNQPWTLVAAGQRELIYIFIFPLSGARKANSNERRKKRKLKNPENLK